MIVTRSEGTVEDWTLKDGEFWMRAKEFGKDCFITIETDEEVNLFRLKKGKYSADVINCPRRERPPQLGSVENNKICVLVRKVSDKSAEIWRIWKDEKPIPASQTECLHCGGVLTEEDRVISQRDGCVISDRYVCSYCHARIWIVGNTDQTVTKMNFSFSGKE